MLKAIFRRSPEKTMKDKVADLAQLWLDDGVCKEVFLFGSLSYKNYGNDADIILVVDQKIAELFLKEIAKYYKDGYKDLSHTRMAYAQNAFYDITESWEILSEPIIEILGEKNLVDIFLFPPHWRKSSLVDQVLSAWDPRFKDSVLRQLRRYDEYTGRFIKFKPED